jgi:hypothetical protein
MDSALLLIDLRDTFLLLLVLSPFLFVLSLDSLKYYAVVHRIPQKDLEQFLAHLPKLVQRLYLSHVKEIYSNKSTAQQMISTFNVRRYRDSILPFGFIIATPIVWINTLRDGDLLRFRYILIPILLSSALWYLWHFGSKLRASSPE